MTERALELIRLLSLEPHPEGGYFREIFRSRLMVTSPRVAAARPALTDIYYLLSAGQFSRFHRVRHDEVWHHYEGDPLRLYDYDPQCDSLQSVKLGPVPENDAYKYVVPADHWQAGLPLGDYCLLGCCVAPGFNFRDFSFLQDPHLKERLIAHRPEVAQLI